MGILHYLGLKKEFQGVFKEQTAKQAIEFLKADSQNFDEVIKFLNLKKDTNHNSKNDYEEVDIDEIIIPKEDNFKESKRPISVENEPVAKEGKSNVFSANPGNHIELPTLPDRYINDKDVPFDLTDLNETDGLGSELIKYRKEQGQLRTFMFGTIKEEACALCHKIYPVEFLWVSHIKPRSDCTEDERLDKNIAMPACKFGCDDMFEKGYILVDEVGDIIKNENKYLTPDLSQKILEVIGKKCKAFNNNTSKYFDSRRKCFQNKKPQVSNILKDAYSETNKK